MKSNAPWSVKGIERDARETAKEAAKREGMTVGEWLNHMIYTAGEGEEASSGGEVEGLKLRDVVTAIEHLHKRIGETHAESAGNLQEITRKIGGVVERVQRLERVKPAEGTNEDLAERVEKLERNGGDRDRIGALKALEKAVAQVAVQFNTSQKTSIQRLDATERQLQEFAERIDRVDAGGPGEAPVSDIGFLKDAVEGLSARVARTERVAGEASSLTGSAGESIDPEFVESTGNRLRVLGDEIKRGGDQIRDLETTIGKLSGQIDAAERRSAEGVQKVTETLAELRESFVPERSEDVSREHIDAAVAEATQETEQRVATLQKSFDTMIARLDALGGGASALDDLEEKDDAATALGGEEHIATADDDIVAEDDAIDPVDAFDALDDDVTGAEADAPAATTQGAAETSAEDIADVADAAQSAADDEDDPFAFADDIDAAFDEPAAGGNAEDDFDFDLDDDDEPQSEPSETSEASGLLSEVREVFGKKKTDAADDATDNDQKLDADGQSDDDLTQILADIDELTGGSDTVAENDDESDDDTIEVSTEASLPGEKNHVEDGDAKKSATEEPPMADQVAPTGKPRRNLTPQQKAILVARARKKRLAAAKAEAEKSGDASKLSAAKPAGKFPEETKDETPQTDEDDDEGESRFEKISAAIGALRAKLPIIGAKDRENEDDDDEPVKKFAGTHDAPPRNGDRAALETLKTTVSARPITLALAVAIVLSVAVLFLMIKDFIFNAPDTEPGAAVVTSQPTGSETPAFTDSGEKLEVPAPPAVDPRILYRDAMTGLGLAETDAETAASITKLEEAAALGHPPAQLQLGEFYKTGQGVEQDLGQARTWFRRSANGGNVLAMHRIGVMTARGEGGPADTGEAIGWFELAANRGLVDSQYNLGAIFHPAGDGPASSIQDAGKAYYWYSLAANNGDTQAAPLAATVAGALNPAQRTEIDRAIAGWEALPADQAANELAGAAE